MPRTAIAIQDIPRNSSAQPTFAAADAANGNMFLNDGNVVLLVKNGDASSKTVTVASVACSHGRTKDSVQVVTAGNTGVHGPFATDLFNQKSGTDVNNVYVDYSAGTSVTVAAVRTV